MKIKNWFKNFFSNIPLIILAIFLMVISHPNILFSKGIGFTAFLIYIPVLFCVHKSNFNTLWLLGFIYGSVSYGLYAYWIRTSYPEFIYVVVLGYGFFLSLLFLILKITDNLFKKNAWVIQWLEICAFEYIKTLGFLGLSYGVTAYSQWKNIYFIQICDVIGVFGLNAIIILFSAIVYAFIQKSFDKYFLIKNNEKNFNSDFSNINKQLKNESELKNYSLSSCFAGLFIWIAVVLFVYVYGFVKVKSEDHYDTMTVTAIQNNENSWLDGIEVYTKNIYKLIQLSEESLEMNPQAKIVVWPETAVVPAIVNNYNNPVDSQRYLIVNRLLEYIDSNSALFVIGNGHQVENKNLTKELYNSALVFEPGKNVIPPEPGVYSKMKLVPFSEYFPYQKQFPAIYDYLMKKGLVNWSVGKECVTFRKDNLKFSCLICYEDTFTGIARKQFKEGARCFVCMSNDSWSKSLACQNQHLSIALFRSVENRVPSVRATASGETCFINHKGQIIKAAPDFCEAYVTAAIPVIPSYSHPSIYNIIGDCFGYGICAVVLFLLIMQTILVIINKKSKTSKKVKFLSR